jgi:hypothetical protein
VRSCIEKRFAGFSVAVKASPCCHLILNHRSQARDDAYSEFGLEESSPDQIRPIVTWIGSGFRRRVGQTEGRMKQGLVDGDVVVKKPPNRVGNTRGRCVRHPHLKRTQVIVSRAKIYRLHSVISPGSSVRR